MKRYNLDTTANAVILLDLGTTEFVNKIDEVTQTRRRVVSSKYYQKIKIFNKSEFKHATFAIPLGKNSAIYNIKAIKHNNLEKTYLDEKLIYEEQINEQKRIVKFTMPNLKAGSIIEVEYTVETPIRFNLTSWTFQSDIPVKFSQYKASIPGNYVFNRKLTGYLKLKTNTSTIKRNCFIISLFERASSCEVVTYAMENIPAFIEEDYMTNKNNFISKIKFELSEVIRINGTKDKYTTTWKDVDKKFKTNKYIGLQLKKYKFFDELLPSEIRLLNAELDKAKAVYNFIQNHFTWNKLNGIFEENDIKAAFKAKTGNVGELNISLINALMAVGLQAELVLISIRKNGFPTKLYPVLTDFNYFIAKVTIDNESYLLDATNKLMPFGMLPYKCLNGYGRVLDFKNGSYWFDIIPEKNSKIQVAASLKLHSDGTITGKLRKAYFGYDALIRREYILTQNEEDLGAEFESNFNSFEVIDYKITNKKAINKPVIEIIEVLLEDAENVFKTYLNPYFTNQFKINPFSQENRLYPVDFGYTRKYIVNFSLEIPDNYTIESYPQSKAVSLPENGGNLRLITKKIGTSKITLSSNFKINKPIFYNFEYDYLKLLFNHVINSQKTPIVLKKT
ncbi:MAG: hypothetical protein COB01_05860 [Lutibacter sp.]|nr:MAG: hypothetical protein COB01_05860 [Lutibacter sp.]